MNDLGTTRLETRRLALRKFTVEDAGDMYTNWASDPEVTRYLVWETHSGPDDSKEILETWVPGYADRRQYLWCLAFGQDEIAIGSLGVVARVDENETLEMGYCLSRKFWGQGLMSEALEAASSFLLDQVGARRLEALIDERNLKSQRVLIKCGYRLSEVRINGGRNNLGIYDAQVYRKP